ncbi:High-affinity zinc transport ZRT1 [Hyphodiscus hymeniophilus]|uniref:High-affinity zinc transport ZRT1 n=1 Tax=Hyphodiscus hymeniophilus TaxID=353542 RepID=A0A9P6VNQ7_9HELO|nr:High-affinity zinc transport ZRT1 [Hyphodiscus hymeniophilus]
MSSSDNFGLGNGTVVDLTTADPRAVVCFLNAGENEYNGRLGARISALFVILIISSAATFFPVLAARVRWLRINIYVYLFARYFGAGVIVATAFIHLLDPAYGEIGPQTCVGMTGGWATYSWVPAIVLISVLLIFLMDFGAERYVEHKYGMAHSVADHPNVEALITDHPGSDNGLARNNRNLSLSHNQLHSGDQDENMHAAISAAQAQKDVSLKNQSLEKEDPEQLSHADSNEEMQERSFRQQIAAFLILEFGVIFHSVIIGLNLGTAGDEFSTLYPVLVFHQSFEGLGIGARMSAIPFPRRFSWLPWFLCGSYGLTTPIAIAIGLGLRTTYNSGSYTANVVSGVLDSISAGILIYTGLVELLARDFLFNPELTKESRRLFFMVVCVFVGAGREKEPIGSLLIRKRRSLGFFALACRCRDRKIEERGRKKTMDRNIMAKDPMRTAQYLTTHARNSTSSPPELFLSIPDVDYSGFYCPSCSLPGPCLCSVSNLSSSYLEFSPAANTNSPDNSTLNDFDISAYIATPEPSAHSTPSMSFSTSTPSSPTTINTPSRDTTEKDDWSHVMRDRRRRSGVMSAEEARESASFLNTPEFKNASRKEKEELIARYQKRQQQNRNSQRNFRRRQAKLVDDLREEIEKLKSENGRLTEELSARQKRERKGEGHAGARKKRVVTKEVEIEVLDDDNGDGDGETDEE